MRKKTCFFESWFEEADNFFLEAKKVREKIMPLSVRKDLAQKVNEVDVIREGKFRSEILF